jgi:hypothetical protein
MSFFKTILELLARLFGRQETPKQLPKPPVSAPGDEEPSQPLPSTPPSMTPEEPVEETLGDPPMPKQERPTLSRGTDNKEAAKALQSLLNENGEKLGVDGDYGGGTEKAVKGFQTSYGLTVDGVAGAAVWALLDKERYVHQERLRSVPMPPSLSVSGTKAVAKAWNSYGNLLGVLSSDLGIDPAVACAVLAVESAGEGFWEGKMVIRFENHIFYRWGKIYRAVFDAHFKMNASEKWKDHFWRPDDGEWRALHTKTSGQSEEYAVLEFARTLDDTAALNSISMGAPQIMGFNSPKIGFANVQEMFEVFSEGERSHVLGLFDFIRSDHRMVGSLRKGDWTSFAGIYNGSGQKDYYGGKIGENVTLGKSLGIP